MLRKLMAAGSVNNIAILRASKFVYVCLLGELKNVLYA